MVQCRQGLCTHIYFLFHNLASGIPNYLVGFGSPCEIAPSACKCLAISTISKMLRTVVASAICIPKVSFLKVGLSLENKKYTCIYLLYLMK